MQDYKLSMHHHDKDDGEEEPMVRYSSTNENTKIKIKFLYAIAISIATILRNTHRRLENSTGLIGAVIRRISPIVSYTTPPFIVRPILHAGFSVVSFADAYVLSFVCSVVLFAAPSSAVVLLVKLGRRVEHVVDKLPGEFENAVDGFPLVVRRVPVLGRMLALMLSILLGGECWFEPDVVEEEGGGGGKEEKIEIKEKAWKKVIKPSTMEVAVAEEEEEVAENEIPILDFFEEGWHARPMLKTRK